MANKSYKPFSLTTLQLPAPSSNLTKTEYKEAYGIDLDEVDIPSFKLVVYGNDKYAIDQVKAIENGYEIYFNGRILSITDIVQTSDEVYDIANSTPIYYHPIILEKGGVLAVSLTILDNNPSPYDTFEKVLSKMNEIRVSIGAGSRFNCAGGFMKESAKNTAFVIYCQAANDTRLYGSNDSGVVNYINIESLSDVTVYDPVNKIN